MTLALPQTDGFALDFSRGELTLATKIYNRIENISCSQPISEGVIFGTESQPIATTRGQQEIGDATVEFSDAEEAFDFIDELGDGWAEKRFTASYTLKVNNDKVIKVELQGCRCLDAELDFSQGADGLPVSMPISFLRRLINGKSEFLPG
jgi:hypothetical protein